jgi:glycine betaine/proline transport system substrate-binding protein
VLTAVTPEFAERAPEVVELLKHVQFRNDVMGKLLAWEEDNKATADEAAAYFLANYKDVWKDWLSDDARQKLSAVLE